MISRIFLGKAWHWALLLASVGLLWACGTRRLHVIEFNFFVIAMLIGTAGAILAIVWLHKPGQKVTRERLFAPEQVED